MTEGLTETRPSPSTPARKTREYVQAATGRACAGVLCLQACRQGTTTCNQREGRYLLPQPPRGTKTPLFPAPAQQHPGWGVFPATTAPAPFVAHPLHPFLPLSHLHGVPHLEEASGGCFTPFFRHWCVQLLTSLETQSATGAPPCHIEQMNKDAERMNVTVSALAESVSAALALGNSQRLLPQLARERCRRGKRRCRLFLLPCIFDSLHQKQERAVAQGPSGHLTALLSYPNIIHHQSCFYWQDKPITALPCYTCT